MYSEEVRFCYFVFSFSSDLQSNLQWLIMMKTRLTETFVQSTLAEKGDRGSGSSMLVLKFARIVYLFVCFWKFFDLMRKSVFNFHFMRTSVSYGT